ncbi:GTP-binding protein, partial [Streptomyces sp. NRAIS4]
MSLAVAVVAGLHAEARKAAVERLLADVPGSVVLHHDLATAATGTVVRTVRDRDGLLSTGETPLVNDCACCALREDLVPELHRLADAGTARLAIVELWDSVEPKAMAEVIASGGLTITSVITAVDPALVLPYLGNGDDLAEAGLAAAATDQRTVADTFARQLEYAPVLALTDSPEADDEDRELLTQLHPTARRIPIDHGALADTTSEGTTPAGTAPTDAVSTGATPADAASMGPAPADAMPTGVAPADVTPSGGSPVDATPPGGTPADAMPTSAAPVDPTAAGGKPADAASTGAAPADAMPTSAASADVTPTGGSPVDATPTGAVPADATPTGGSPAGATSTSATPTSAAPADVTPTGAEPADTTPPGATPPGTTPTRPDPKAPAPAPEPAPARAPQPPAPTPTPDSV